MFVPKKHGTWRQCTDYCRLYKVVARNRLALPLAEELFNGVQGAHVFAKIDLRNAYHQVRICKGDRWKTAF
jgi:hypothetical protein